MTTASKRLVLQSLTIRKFRHLAQPVDLQFTDAHTLLVGLNGTGKTNLLVLLDACCRLDFSAMADDRSELDIEFLLANTDLRLKVKLTRGPAVQDGETRTGSFTVRALSEGHDLHLERDSAGLQEMRVFRRRLAYRVRRELAETSPGGTPPLQGLVLGMLVSPAFRRLDEALEVFGQLISESEVHLKIIDRHQSNNSAGLGVPTDLTFHVMGTTLGQRRLPISSSKLTWLHVAKEACGFDELEIELSGPVEEVIDGEITRTYSPFDFYARQGTSRFHHRSFSFGQKRILAACWYTALMRPDGVIIADELVNGLHHGAVDLILDLAGPTQGFFASQNPLLFDRMDFSTWEDFRLRIVRCTRADDGWVWRQPSIESSKRFQAAHELGFQHVSELLAAEGLW